MKQAQTDTNTQRFPIRYAFYDRTNIQKFLEQKSEEGWMLQTFNSSTFIRTDPKKRHFSIVYYSNKSTKDRSPYERRQEFLEYCRHDGWELVTQNDRMMIFCSELDSPTPIETDPLMEVNSIHAVAKHHFWGDFIPLSLLAAFWLTSLYFDIAYDLTELLSRSFEWMYLLMLGISLSVSIREIVIYYRWYHAAKTAATYGQFLDPPKRNDITRVMTVVQSICLIITLFTDNDLPFMMLVVLGFTALIFLVRWILKKCKVSNDILGGVTFLIGIPLFIILLLLSAFFLGGKQSTMTFLSASAI